MTLTVDEISAIEAAEPIVLPALGPARREFDAADDESVGLLVAGAASAAVWLLVAVTVWRLVARRRTRHC